MKNDLEKNGPKKTYRLRWAALLLGVLVAAFLWDFSVQKNFDVVVPGKIYRSGQPREKQLEKWIKKYHLKTIISLRHSLPAYEKKLAERYNINVHQITLSSRSEPPEEIPNKILNLLTDEQNLPLLYHCQSGADRAGLVTALYRVEVQNWPLWKAFLEMDMNYHLPFYRPVPQRYIRSHYKPDLAPAIIMDEQP